MTDGCALSTSCTHCGLYITIPPRHHYDSMLGAKRNTSSTAYAFLWINICFRSCRYGFKHNKPPDIKEVQSLKYTLHPFDVYNYRTFLFSAPGVVTITFSGLMISAPFAVAAPLNIFSTIALKLSTTAPSVTYSAVPLIW